MTRSSWHGEKCHKHSQWKYSRKKWRQRETKNVRKIQGNLRKQRYKNKFDCNHHGEKWKCYEISKHKTANDHFGWNNDGRRTWNTSHKKCACILMWKSIKITKILKKMKKDEKTQQQIGETRTDSKWNKYQLQSNWILLIPREQPNQMSPLEIQHSSESNRIITVYMEQFVLVNTFLKRTSLP